MTSKFYCRICFTSNEKVLKPIKERCRDNFHSITGLMLVKSDIISNLICTGCDLKVQETRKYCDDLRYNETQLMNQWQNSESEFIAIPSSENDVLKPEVDVLSVKQEMEEEEGESSIKLVDISMPFENESTDNKKADEIAKEVMQEMFGDSSSDDSSIVLRRQHKSVNQYKKRTFPVGFRIKAPRDPPKSSRAPRQQTVSNPELDREFDRLPDTIDGKVDCFRCSKKILKIYYRQHVERVHLAIKNFFCDKCGRGFYKYSVLEQHMNQHLNLQPFECPYECGQSFSNKSSRKTHVKAVHMKDAGGNDSYVCEICAMQFNARHKLKNHMLVIHEGHRWKCPYPNCSLEYKIERSLNTHIEDHHEIRTAPCEICGKIQKVGNQMFRHKQRKHMEKTFACGGCKRKFRFLHELKNHEKMHTDEKDFVCHLCGAKFHIRWNLKRHIDERHKKQTFSCDLCSSVLRNRDSYRTHVKRVHKDLSPEELQKIFEHIAKMEPHYKISEGQLGEVDDDEDKPQKKKIK